MAGAFRRVLGFFSFRPIPPPIFPRRAGMPRFSHLAPPLRPLGLVLVGLLGLAGLVAPPPAHALKVATWNVLKYTQTTAPSRRAPMRTVMAAMDPDVIVLQELLDTFAADSFLINVLNANQPGQWSKGPYLSTTESCIYYKTSKIDLLSTGTRNIGPYREVYIALLRFPGYVGREAQFRLYSIHLKAGTPSTPDPVATDSSLRRSECDSLRHYVNNLNYGVITSNFLIAGDTNFYGDWEGGYIRLTESQLDNDGRGFDPLSMPGTWNNGSYALNHSQSTCGSGGACPTSDWSGGGLDDRFDLFLRSAALGNGEGTDVVPGTYGAYGNDGNHYNLAIDSGTNFAVGATVATALRNSSDHLPVVWTLQAPAKIGVSASQLSFGDVIVGASASSNLTVSNPASTPADELTYSFAAPAGFGAPAGTFNTNAGQNAVHAITLDTSTPAQRAGTLTIANDDPDSSAKAVLLSGRVLAHAQPSLDSLTVTVEDTLDFGAHDGGGFSDLSVCVHDAGYNALQAKLELTGGAITGESRFSIVGGFAAAEIAGTSRCYAIHFDDGGAPPNTSFEGTLTFTSTDQPLPGATARPNLVVHLRAQTLTTTTGVGGGRPSRIAFLPPRPNPAHGALALRFDLPSEARVAIDLIDLSGRKVATAFAGEQSAGHHELRWRAVDASGAAIRAGLYFVRFASGGYTESRRIVLLP